MLFQVSLRNLKMGKTYRNTKTNKFDDEINFHTKNITKKKRKQDRALRLKRASTTYEEFEFGSEDRQYIVPDL